MSASSFVPRPGLYFYSTPHLIPLAVPILCRPISNSSGAHPSRASSNSTKSQQMGTTNMLKSINQQLPTHPQKNAKHRLHPHPQTGAGCQQGSTLRRMMMQHPHQANLSGNRNAPEYTFHVSSVIDENKSVIEKNPARSVLLGVYPTYVDHSSMALRTPTCKLIFNSFMSKLSHRAEENGRSNNTDVNARLNTIENLLTRLVSSIPQAIASRPFAGDAGSPDVSSLTASGEEIFHPHVTLPDPASRVTMPHKPPPSGLFPSNMSYTTPPSRTGYGWGLREGRRIALSLDDNFELRDMLQTLKESGVSQGHLEWLIAGVPGRRMADGLVELYFRYVIVLIGRVKVRALTITPQGY